MSKAEEILSVQGQLESDRCNFESLWQEIAERVLPSHASFTTKDEMQGQKKTEKVFDSTAERDLNKFSAALDDLLTPRNQKWHTLEADDPDLNKKQEVREYLEEITDILFRARYSPRTNFASQIHEVYRSLGAFGTCGLFVGDTVGSHINYRSLHLGDLYIMENKDGVIDRVHRKMMVKASVAVQMFKDLPEEIQTAAEKTPLREYEFIHCVKPNDDIDVRRADYRGMRYESYYLSKTGKKVIEEGGYNSFPYAVSRYVTAPRETYGRSPAMMVLPDIKTLNEMEKTMLRMGHLTSSPPLLLSDDGALGGVNLRPAALIAGGLSSDGRANVQALNVGANFNLTQEMSDRRRQLIDDAFLVTLFQILVETPQMTATEVMERAKEKGMLLAPTGGRQQSELLGTIIERELDILARAGQLPPKPKILEDAGSEVSIIYSSPLNLAQRSTEGVAIMRTLESMAPLAQIDPSVMDLFDSEEIGRTLAEINGMPAKLLKSKEDMEAIKEQKMQAAQASALLQAAETAGSAAQSFANAGAMAQAPSAQPLPNMIPA